MAVVLIEPVAAPVALRSVSVPHAEPLHSRIERTGTVPPLLRSYVINRSPGMRTGVTPFALSVSD